MTCPFALLYSLLKPQLESFEEQLKSIDAQIAQIVAETSKQQTEKQETSSLSQTQLVSSVKTRLNGEARVLEMEIKIDELRGGASASKKEHLADLQKQFAVLTARISDDLIKVNEEIKDSNDNQSGERENSGTTGSNNTDSDVKLSVNVD